MNSYEAIYINCENHDPWVRGSDPRVGPTWPYGENVLKFKISFLLAYIREKRNVRSLCR